MELQAVDRILEEYRSDKSWLVMILQDLQEAYNYLPEDVLRHVSRRLDVPLSRVYRVATFYSSFSLRERGRHVIRVCDGTACHMRGSVNLLEDIVRLLNVQPGQTTPDKVFTLETVACLGACALAPVMTVGHNCHGQMTLEKVRQTLEAYRSGDVAAAPAAAGASRGRVGAGST